MATNANETDFGIFDSTGGKLNLQFDYASDNILVIAGKSRSMAVIFARFSVRMTACGICSTAVRVSKACCTQN
jgi:hypothetical protein